MTDISQFPTSHGRIKVADFHGIILRTGKDLGVVTRFASKHPVDVVELRALPTGGYGVAFHFWRGLHGATHAHALTYWASWQVALIFLQGRRSWGIDRLSVDAALWPMVIEHWAATRLVAHGTIVHQRRSMEC